MHCINYNFFNDSEIEVHYTVVQLQNSNKLLVFFLLDTGRIKYTFLFHQSVKLHPNYDYHACLGYHQFCAEYYPIATRLVRN